MRFNVLQPYKPLSFIFYINFVLTVMNLPYHCESGLTLYFSYWSLKFCDNLTVLLMAVCRQRSWAHACVCGLPWLMTHPQHHHLPASSQSWPASSTPPKTRARLDLPTPCSPRRTTLYTWDSASLPVEMTESEESDAQLPRCCSFGE